MTAACLTSQKIRSLYVHGVDNSIMTKNKFEDIPSVITDENKWVVAHIYLQHDQEHAHEMTAVRDEKTVTLYDSFMNYRAFGGREFTRARFQVLIDTLFNHESISARRRAYKTLCDAPCNYIDNWNGEFVKCWIHPLK